jgi:hypothetical protein
MKRFLPVTVVFAIALLFAAFSGTASYAQDSRGSITGQVTDPTGAVVPNAQVTVTSTETGAVTKVKTTGEGFYTAPALMPGGYKVTVNAPGFSVFERTGIQLHTQENATVNVKLAVGSASAVVTVTAATPLIDTADASTGQVLTTQEVQDLPSDGRSPLGFARIMYGVVTKAKHAQSTASPVSNQTVDDFSLGGGNSSSNELLLNGVPNMQDGDRYAAYSPELDSVNEVRVDEFGANAMYGDTSGGTVNITTKSGTNQFHGSASWFYQAAGCSALDGKYQSRSANGCTWMAGLPYLQKVGSSVPSATHENQVGGTIGGPVWIPHVFNGHNKLFFFYSYEAYVGQQPPGQTVGTVPTQAERSGDFSALLNLGSQYQFYNPNTASGSQTNYTRTAIPGNVFSNAGLAVSPIAQAYLKLVPLPNYSGPTTKADGENNFFAYVPTIQNYRSHMGRLDYNISANDKIWGSAYRSRYLNSQSNEFNTVLSGTTSDQIFAGGQVEEVHTFSPTLFSDVRGGISRTDSTNAVASGGISPSTFGFPGYLAQNASTLAIPRIDFGDASNPLSYSEEPGSIENFDTLQLFADVTKIYKSHTFIGGIDFRAYKDSTLNPGYADGEFKFSNSAGNPVTASNSAAAQPFGSSLALFMLGIPTSGTEGISPALQYNSFLDAFFIQDDWKARPNWTVSMGVRFEHETPVDESQNRMVIGFNPTATNEATTASGANYAKSPSSLLAAGSFLPTGGAVYATSSNRNAYHVAPLYVSPRIGVSWAPTAMHDKAVVRFGFGIYDNPFGDYDFGQSYGYSTTTPYVASANNGETNNTLGDPFPTSASAAAVNPIQVPTGSALGVNAELGNSMGFYSSVVKVQYSERTSLDVQYQIGKTMMIDLGYIENHQVHMPEGNQISAIPLLPYLSHSQYYNIAATNLLSGSSYKGGPASTSIPNPFKGVQGMTGTLATSTLLSPSQFLTTYPEFSSVTENLIPAQSSNYNALNARFAKTMGHGLTMNGVFEWSRLLGTFNQLNPGAPYTYGSNTSDFPFHFAGYGTYQLPFGRGRQFFSGANRVVDDVIGGWQVSAIYNFLSGYDLSWVNVIYTGNWHDFHMKQHSSANVNGTPVFNTSVFDTRTCQNPSAKCDDDPLDATFNPNIQPNSDNYRTFPQYAQRQDYTSDWDGNVQKDIKAAENVDIQLRLDGFNLLNRPQYNTPNLSPTSASFGTTSGVYSGTFARQLQVGAHIVF